MSVGASSGETSGTFRALSWQARAGEGSTSPAQQNLWGEAAYETCPLIEDEKSRSPERSDDPA
jgi:hypothetical protein